MRRHSGQKALYEAMSRQGSKRKRKGVLARLRPQLEKLRPQLEKLAQLGRKPGKGPTAGAEPAAAKPAPVTLKPPKAVELPEMPSAAPAKTWLRPKAVQFNDGRFEVSVPYQIGIIIGLGVVLVVLMGFWFGRLIGRIDERSRYNPVSPAPRAALGGEVAQPVAPDEEAKAQDTEASSEAPKPAEAGGGAAAVPASQNDHVIVLAQYETEDQLKPLRAFFESRGIYTSIMPLQRLRSYFVANALNVNLLPKGDGFLLVSELCENPERAGTNGYNLRQRIIENGRQYQPAQGFRSFDFSDVYGMKVR